MLVARAYSVLDRIVVEVSCVHSADPTGSHLVIREERSGLPLGSVGALRALADVADLAAMLIAAQRAGTGSSSLVECESGWFSPSD